MKLKHFPIVLLAGLFLLFSSCKKKDDQTTSTTPTTTLNAAVTGGTLIYTHMETFMTAAIKVAADSGHIFFFPNNDTNTLKLKSGNDIPGWTGPDALGYFTRYYTSSGYTFTERIHVGDTIDYLITMAYSGADGNFEIKTTTKYIRKTTGGKTTWDGYSIWDVSNFGDNQISRWQWKMTFSDWDPATSAGTYDWFWGVSENLGGNTVPFHRFQHIVATQTTPSGWLHCNVIFYDQAGVQVWNFSYDTPWLPVEMPVIPNWP